MNFLAEVKELEKRKESVANLLAEKLKVDLKKNFPHRPIDFISVSSFSNLPSISISFKECWFKIDHLNEVKLYYRDEYIENASTNKRMMQRIVSFIQTNY